jgi:hypothetical protein
VHYLHYNSFQVKINLLFGGFIVSRGDDDGDGDDDSGDNGIDDDGGGDDGNGWDVDVACCDVVAGCTLGVSPAESVGSIIRVH